MADPRPTYMKLTRRNRRLTGSSQIWIADDGTHLLLVRTTWYVQTYSRFRLRDIQALIVHAHELSLPAHIGALMMTLVLMALSIQSVTSGFAKGFFGILFGAVLSGLIVNLGRGRRASVTLVTSATRMVLPAITRLKRAEEFVAQLTPRIQAAQADLPILAPEHREHVIQPASTPPALPPEPPPIAISIVLYVSVLLAGAISLIALQRRVPESLANLSWTLGFAGFAIGIYVAVVDRKLFAARLLAAVTGIFSAADLVISAWSSYAVLSGTSGPLPTGMPAHLQAMPLWFIQYSRAAAPLQAILGVMGLVFTWYRVRAKEDAS